MADIDVGEMFYNFMLDPKLHPYCGIDFKILASLLRYRTPRRWLPGSLASPPTCRLYLPC
jgi:hypothetical protein